VNNIFPKIETINDIVPHVSGMEYIGILNAKNGATVICYQISNSMSFASALEKECRGISFDKDGKIIVRSMHKFFNVNERAESKLENVDWTQVYAVYNKMDGSMINSGFMDGVLFTKSKKSFSSPVAIMAHEYIMRNPKYYDFASYCFTNGLTPTFEYTSPKHRIVLDYKEEALTVLQIREMVSGRYLSIEEMQDLCSKFDIAFNTPLWHGKDFNIKTAIETLKTASEIEGYVIQFNNGDMVKIKSNWYSSLHHAVTFIRERDIAELVLDELFDDFIAFLTTNRPTADVKRAIEINDMVTLEINRMRATVDLIVLEHLGLPFKEISDKFKGHPLHSFILRKSRGQRVDYVLHYRQNHLPLWTLKSIDLGEISDFSSLG